MELMLPISYVDPLPAKLASNSAECVGSIHRASLNFCGGVSHGTEETIKTMGHTTNTRPSYGRNHPKWS